MYLARKLGSLVNLCLLTAQSMIMESPAAANASLTAHCASPVLSWKSTAGRKYEDFPALRSHSPYIAGAADQAERCCEPHWSDSVPQCRPRSDWNILPPPAVGNAAPSPQLVIEWRHGQLKQSPLRFMRQYTSRCSDGDTLRPTLPSRALRRSASQSPSGHL